MPAAAKTAKNPEVQQKLALAVSHPLRVELVRLYAERTWSPNELALKLRQPVGNVAYHTRVLEEAGAVELVGTRPVRGATEHFYRGLTRAEIGDAEWERMPPQARLEVSCTIVQNTFSEVYAALESGAMDARLDRHLSWRHVTLDEEGWRELCSLLLRTLREVEGIEASSATRRASSGEAAISAVAALMGFERGAMPG